MPLDWSPRIGEILAALEDGCSVTAGVSMPEERPAPVGAVPANALLALGRFVVLSRRKLGLSVPALAAAADLDVDDVREIEASAAEACEPRILVRLARALNRPQNELLYLAGLMQPREVGLSYQGIKFAASAEPSMALTTEEENELSAFFTFLDARAT